VSSDNKGSDKKDESFDLLAHEKKISELYQNTKAFQVEKSSAQLDSKIMAMAKQQLSGNSALLTQEQSLSQQSLSNKNKQRKTQNKSPKSWQWPFSLVASVGLLGILFITQRDYFINPSNIVVGETDIFNGPTMQAPDISQSEKYPQEIAVDQSFQEMKSVSSSSKSELLSYEEVMIDKKVMLDKEMHLDKDMHLDKEMLLDKEFSVVARKRLSISQPQKALEEQIVEKSLLEDNSVKTSMMSLSDMSELAGSLKIEQAIQNISKLEASASSVDMQQILFKQLIQYQKSHTEFEITEKYLSVLTDEQIRKLKTSG
jgi:hypothetical protein